MNFLDSFASSLPHNLSEDLGRFRTIRNRLESLGSEDEICVRLQSFMSEVLLQNMPLSTSVQVSPVFSSDEEGDSTPECHSFKVRVEWQQQEFSLPEYASDDPNQAARSQVYILDRRISRAALLNSAAPFEVASLICNILQVYGSQRNKSIQSS